MALTDKLTVIGDAIRTKTGGTAKLNLDEMASAIATIETDNTNFKIVGGTTQPTNPKENTIWVNTDMTIGEYQFAVNEPTKRVDGTSLQTGDVWFKKALVSRITFNILKENLLEVIVSKVSLYKDGSWVKADGLFFINNQWLALNYVLIPNTTDAAISKFTKSNSTITSTTSNFTFSGNIQTTTTSYAKMPIDVTEYSTMTMVGTVTPGGDHAAQSGYTSYTRVGLFSSVTTGTLTIGHTTRREMWVNYDTSINKTYDITGLTGTYYWGYHAIGNEVAGYSNTTSGKITSVIFE